MRLWPIAMSKMVRTRVVLEFRLVQLLSPTLTNHRCETMHLNSSELRRCRT